MLKRIAVVLFLSAALLISLSTADVADNSSNINSNNETVEISPKCAAVLLAAGTSLGSALAYTLTPMALCSSGFCSTGIAGGSFASSWQATMPFIAKGSLFAKLQSIAMGSGVKIALSGALVGGSVSLEFMTTFCDLVDETDPDSALGRIFSASEVVVTKAIETKNDAKDYCDTSETCTEMSNYFWDTTAWASSQLNHFKKVTSDKVRSIPLQWEIRQLKKQLEAHREEIADLELQLSRKEEELAEYS